MKSISFSFLLMLCIASLFLIVSCDLIEPTDDDFTPDPEFEESEQSFGWTGDDNVGQIPTSTNLGFGSTNLPSSVDLTPFFPPVGNQGQFGTCVAWATAYNAKTALSAMKRNLSSSQLSSPANQYSPKDLFISIPDNQKGSNCGGTNFGSAMNMLLERGVATLATVPYNLTGDCWEYNMQQTWTNEAAGNRIKYWRKTEGSVQSVKQNLANNIPVVLGIKVPSNFENWNSSSVLTSIPGYNGDLHAMVIVGYDDTKGPNGAFRVVNSWSQHWADGGYIWIDYNLLISELSYHQGQNVLFIMADEEGSSNPPDNDTPTATGVDLAPWVFSDVSTASTSGISYERSAVVNIYNIGSTPAVPQTNWDFYYVYFNAYNANDYGVIFADGFGTSVAPNTFDCFPEGCIFNYTIPAGGNFAQTVFNQTSVDRTYSMPNITGEYYLALIADVGDRYQETDEINNIFYTTQYPIYFQNGVGYQSDAAEERGEEGDANFVNSETFNFINEQPRGEDAGKFNSIVKADNRNAYTTEEIKEFFKKEVESGRINARIPNGSLPNGASPYTN